MKSKEETEKPNFMSRQESKHEKLRRKNGKAKWKLFYVFHGWKNYENCH